MPNFLTNEKSQESLLLNVLSNIDIHVEMPIMVQKNDSSEKSSNTPLQLCLRIAKVPKT